ncbi:MAG: thioredoxin-dependent thiol peroxidase [Sandaracinaceae bacterium]
MLQEGKKAPAFQLPSSSGEKVRLKDLAGKWVVLYFYPKDMTPGCTTEARDFRDASEALAARDAVVFGISKDSVERHCKFIEKESLDFQLLSDEPGAMIEKYGAWGEKNLYGKKSMGIVRTTVIVDPSGNVAKVFPKVRVKDHVAKVLEALDQLRGA